MSQGNKTAAFEHLSAAHSLCVELGYLGAVAVVEFDLARLLLVDGRSSEAIPILERSRNGFMHLGRPDQAKLAQELLDSVADDP